MAINEEAFFERLNKLNEQQRDAVDTIYGPVMVIAGPGTGKTEVLSMRIANLLRSEAQVQPNEILCLTYTDEATNSMRRRLLQIIGPDAHRVNIGTFHAFCNNVIQNNSEYFSMRSLQPITDLERSELLYEMIEELPKGHALRRLSGNIYFDVSKLNRLFDMMKRENITAEQITKEADAYIEDLPNRKEFVYQRNGKGFKKGDLKQTAIDEEQRKMNDTKAAASLLDVYNQKMKSKGWYDFNDMILWVLDAFKNNPALLQNYQERNQFILVDEFQDTNGAQNELLNQLTEFWDDPNIFVVGDDDQSIYEFQGARIKNIADFYDKHRDNIKLIVLPQNYRSSQAILDKAMATIEQNEQRLVNELSDLKLDKNIVASADRFKDGKETIKPIVKEYTNILHEEADIVLQVEKLYQHNVPLNHIAIIYAQHKQADNIIALFERKNIPYAVKKPVNVLELPLIEQLMKLLEYLDAEQKQPFSGEPALFELMHSPYYGIDPVDIATVSLFMYENKKKHKDLGYWRMVLSNGLQLEALNLRTTTALQRLGNNLNSWLMQLQQLPVPLLVEKLIYESGIVQHLVKSKEYTWNIQVLNTFFEYVKEMYRRDSSMKVSGLLQMIEQMKRENISLPIQKVVHAEHGVQLYTAHGAKGNEFEHVFLIGATKNFWENKRGAGNEYKLPDTITNTESDKDKTYKTEVARRLFYVALTRAKKHLHVSYAAQDNNGKPLEHSLFVDEISNEEERLQAYVPEEQLVEQIAWAMKPIPDVRIKLGNKQAIDNVLDKLNMSASTLTKYLNCPLSFYYENILKVPFQKNDALVFGSAVHYALERMFREMKKRERVFPTKEEVVSYFDYALRNEEGALTPIQFERRMEQGHTAVAEYYDQYINEFPKDVEVEFMIPRYMLDGVPVTGKIDRIDFVDGKCNVIDYKTGDPDKSAKKYTASPNEADPDGGDYWRQMVFYKLLIENYKDRNWIVGTGLFDYIQRGDKSREFKRIVVPVFAKDEEIVMVQLKDSYQKIMNHEFDKGCGKDDCSWCNFARKYELVRPEEAIEIDDV
ncbi:MAG: ATP-dependent helicase [Chitinophagaceae bacterium]|nr:ATP-dependent helicase [Chitinophagaceae bacterium]